MSVFAGIDAGTQSIKVLVYDAARGIVLDQVSAGLDLISDSNGTREQEASWWLQAVHQCFSEIDPSLRQKICAIAVSGQQHGFVALSESGEVLAPVKLWCDTATTAEVAELTNALGGEAACIALTGNPILPGYTASKVLWTKRYRSEAYQRLNSILLPHDYLNYYLTGVRYSEYGDSSGTGWFDVRSRRYSLEVLGAIDSERDLSACLPKLVDADQLIQISAKAAEQLGLNSDVLVGSGGGDNMMAAIGTGCVTPSRLSMSLGTSGTLFCYSEKALVSESGAWAAFCSSSGGWLPLICTMNCTVATETVAQLFGFNARDSDALIFASSPGASGISMLPFFNGERTPNLPLAKGAVFGFDLHNASARNYYRAAMEGASFSLRYGYDTLIAAGMTFDAITLTGGGSKSKAWRQMIADMFGLPVYIPMQSEGAAFGAALAAMWAYQKREQPELTLSNAIDDRIPFDVTQGARPNAAVSADYDCAYARFRACISRFALLERQSEPRLENARSAVAQPEALR